MKSNSKFLPLIASVWGTFTALALLGYCLLGMDPKGLLLSFHPLAILVWVLTVSFGVFTLLSVSPLGGSNDYARNFTPSVSAAIGCFALAGGITVTLVSDFGSFLLLEKIRSLCGLIAIPALICLGLKRFSGKQPFFLLPGVVCLYLTLHTISHYQIWSSRPQLMNWFFPMAASLSLALFSYHQTAFTVSMGNRRSLLAAGLLAGFFCILACLRENGMLYLGGALWALTNLCSRKDDGHEAA